MVNAAGGLQVYYHVRGNQHVTSDGCQFISRFSAGGPCVLLQDVVAQMLWDAKFKLPRVHERASGRQRYAL